MTAKLFGLLELQQNLKKDFFIYEYLWHIVRYCTSNKNLLSANFWSDPISAKMDKISTKMC
jgi:hypothetical protein